MADDGGSWWAFGLGGITVLLLVIVILLLLQESDQQSSAPVQEYVVERDAEGRISRIETASHGVGPAMSENMGNGSKPSFQLP